MAASLARPADLLRFNLLHPARSKRLWPDVLRFLGVEVPSFDHSLTLDDAATTRFAVRQGLGVGLISVLDAQEDIAAGLLSAPLGMGAIAHMPDDAVPGFYLITTRARLRAKPVAALHRWLLEQDWQTTASPASRP